MAPDNDAESRIALRTRLVWFISLVPPLFLLDLGTKRHGSEPYGALRPHGGVD